MNYLGLLVYLVLRLFGCVCVISFAMICGYVCRELIGVFVRCYIVVWIWVPCGWVGLCCSLVTIGLFGG